MISVHDVGALISYALDATSYNLWCSMGVFEEYSRTIEELKHFFFDEVYFVQYLLLLRLPEGFVCPYWSENWKYVRRDD